MRRCVARRQPSPAAPAEEYALLRAEATRLSGAPGHITRRVALHHHVYLDSAGNHTFPLVALHGALWAAGFFETTGRLGQALRPRYLVRIPEFRGYPGAHRQGDALVSLRRTRRLAEGRSGDAHYNVLPAEYWNDRKGYLSRLSSSRARETIARPDRP